MSSAGSKRGQREPSLLSAETEALFSVFREHSPTARAGQVGTQGPGTAAASALQRRIVRRIEEATSSEDGAEAWLLAAPLPLEAGEPRHFGRCDPVSTPLGGEEAANDPQSLCEVAAEALAPAQRRGAPEHFPSPPHKEPPSPPPRGLASARNGAEATAAPVASTVARIRPAWLLLGGALAAAGAFAVLRLPAAAISADGGRAAPPGSASAITAVPHPDAIAEGPEGLLPNAPLQMSAAQRHSDPHPLTPEAMGPREPSRASPVPAKRDRAQPDKDAVGRPEKKSEVATNERERGATEAKSIPEMVPAADIGSAAGTSRRRARPSIGAVQGALGAVLGKAKYCVIGDPRPSQATIVFDSSGRVTRVTVNGPAAGLPTENCIVEALQGARVQPFSDAEFSVRTTVRP